LGLGVKAGNTPSVSAGSLKSPLTINAAFGVVDQVIFRDAVVLDGITNDAAEESDVRAGTNLAEEISDRGRGA